jgi:hypothetical protein
MADPWLGQAVVPQLDQKTQLRMICRRIKWHLVVPQLDQAKKKTLHLIVPKEEYYSGGAVGHRMHTENGGRRCHDTVYLMPNSPPFEATEPTIFLQV